MASGIFLNSNVSKINYLYDIQMFYPISDTEMTLEYQDIIVSCINFDKLTFQNFNSRLRGATWRTLKITIFTLGSASNFHHLWNYFTYSHFFADPRPKMKCATFT